MTLALAEDDRGPRERASAAAADAPRWRLLLVASEPQPARALLPDLIVAGFDATAVQTGGAALAALARESFDVVLLDLDLPDMDGKEVIARGREWCDAPMIVLSDREDEQERIDAFDLGADDFVSQGIGVGELRARLRAALRGRERRFASASRFEAGALIMDFAARRVFLGGREVRLTPREYDVLRLLARHAGMVLTHRQIIAAVWGPDSRVDAQFVRVVIGQLRHKLSLDAASSHLLRTESGVGYRLIAEDEVHEAGGSEILVLRQAQDEDFGMNRR